MMDKSRFAHLERHVLAAGGFVRSAVKAHAAGDDRDALDYALRALDDLGAVVMALLNEVKPDQELVAEPRAEVVQPCAHEFVDGAFCKKCGARL